MLHIIPLYLKHVLFLAVLLPIIALFTVVVSILSILSVIPLVGQYANYGKNGLRNVLMQFLIPGSLWQEAILPIPKVMTKSASTCSLYLGGNGSNARYSISTEKNRVLLPHVHNQGGGMHERVDHYVRYVKAILEKNPHITTLKLHGHSMGGGILAQVVAHLSEDDELLEGKTIELTLDRTYDNLAHASSGVLGYAVPPFLLSFIYTQLDLNLNTEKAIAQYTAKSKQIKTTIIVSNVDEVLADSVLFHHAKSGTIDVKLIDKSHNYHNPFINVRMISNPETTILPRNQTICYLLDVMIVLTALQFTGISSAGLAVLWASIPTILPLTLYFGVMVLLVHGLCHAVAPSAALQNMHIKQYTGEMRYNYLIECLLFVTLFTVGTVLMLTLPISISPLLFITAVMLPSIVILALSSYTMNKPIDTAVKRSSSVMKLGEPWHNAPALIEQTSSDCQKLYDLQVRRLGAS